MASANGARPPYGPRGWLRAIAYNSLWWCAEGFRRAASACLYLAAGLLRRDELRASSETQWSEYCTSADDVDAGLDAWERRFYAQYLRSGDRVLVVGCGAGRDLIALRAQGFDVTGLDQSAALIEQARAQLARRGLSAPLIAAPVETAMLNGFYDVVLLATCYSSLLDSAARVAALARVRAHLAPRGRVLLGYGGYTGQPRAAVWLMRAGVWLSRADWPPERGDVFSRSHVAPRLLAYEHYFRPEDVARECAAAGLRVIADFVEGRSARRAVAVSD